MPSELAAIVDQHRDIAARISELHPMLHRIASGQAPGDAAKHAARDLAELRQRLRSHLDLEEHSELLSKAVAAAPRLAGRAQGIGDQHASLRACMAEIVELADRAGTSTDAWESVEAAFRSFADELGNHELVEDGLLNEAYLSDLGGSG